MKKNKIASLVVLKKRRSTLQGNVTKLLKYIKNITDETDTMRIHEIKARLSLIHQLRDEFIAAEDKIVELDEDEELDQDFEEN